jgi:hypothetical protein
LFGDSTASIRTPHSFAAVEAVDARVIQRCGFTYMASIVSGVPAV